MQVQIKPQKMAQWPPSPSVEDEATALSREHSIDAAVQRPKSDDQPAVDRGAIDQYPVIIDSPDLNKSTQADVCNQIPQNQCTTDACSSDDSAGPPTPPSVFKDTRTSGTTPTRSTVDPLTSSSSLEPPLTLQPASDRGRPQVTRIQTDLGGDIHFMATGTRRKPSPYSYTHPSATHDSTTGCLANTDNLLSPESAHQQSRARVLGRRSFDRSVAPSFEDSARLSHGDQPRSQHQDDTYHAQSTPIARSSPQTQYGFPQPQSAIVPRNRGSFTEPSGNSNFRETQRTSFHDRRLSKESSFMSSEEERSAWHRSASKRSTIAVRDSPYTSSAEESPRQHGRRSGHGSENEQKKLRRRSSHRKERPSLQGFQERPRSDAASVSATDTFESKNRRYETYVRPQQQLVTPISSDVSRTEMEDYFANAFKANELRQSQRAHTPRSSGSTLASPLTSPPRTPRSERQSKGYFDLTPTNPRPTQRSRPPSVDEGQVRDSRSHGNLLSAATAGAAVAARAAEFMSKSQSTSLENGRQTSGPRSGQPSPVCEESRVTSKAAVYNSGSSLATDRGLLKPGYTGRPLSRGTLDDDGELNVSVKPHSHAHRSLSYCVPDHVQPWNVSYPVSAVSPTLSTNVAPTSSYASARPQSRSTRSSLNTTEISIPHVSTFGLPICPRPNPVAGCHDWYTIKEMSTLDICPTCANVVANSRYRNLLVPSLPRPYNEPSVCAMSKPWVRVAFLQSRRQERPDLKYIRDVTKPSGRPLCVGDNKEIARWYYIDDPKTKEPIPGVSACTTCVALVDQIFPDIGSVFYRPEKGLTEEFRCCLHSESKHFQSTIDQLEQLSDRCGRRWRSVDTEDLTRHLRRVARYQPCTRDELHTSRAWHLMVELPEFTMCDDCYDEVVKPIQDRPIARDITRSLKPVPRQRGNGGDHGMSCQLYSERMRKVFRDAVELRSFGLLRDAVKTRVNMQRRLEALNKLYEQDLRRGIDRRHEMEKNWAIWKTVE